MFKAASQNIAVFGLPSHAGFCGVPIYVEGESLVVSSGLANGERIKLNWTMSQPQRAVAGSFFFCLRHTQVSNRQYW